MGFGMMGGMGLLWIGVIVLGVLVVRTLFSARKEDHNDKPDSALSILEERYARGEITREQYLAMMKDLS